MHSFRKLIYHEVYEISLVGKREKKARWLYISNEKHRFNEATS